MTEPTAGVRATVAGAVGQQQRNAALRQPAFLEWDAAGFGAELVPVCTPECTAPRCDSPGKAVHLRGWSSRAVAPDDLRRWGGKPSNVGVRTRSFPAIDIDIADAPIADAVERLTAACVGAGPVRTRGNAARRLVLCRLEGEPFPKKKLSFRLPSGAEGAIEVLGDGQQAVVEGTHHTGATLEWRPARPVAAELPAITEADATALLAAVTKHLVELGCEIEGAKQPKQARAGQGRPAAAPTTRSFAAETWSDVAGAVDEALRRLDPDTQHDEWLRVGMALHAKDASPGGPAFAAWDAWSSRGAKYPGRDELERRWRSFHADGGVTLGTLFAIAGVHAPAPATGGHRLPTCARPLSDAGNAERFVDRNRELVRYVHKLDRWLFHDGARFALDDRREVYRLGIATARRIHAEAAAAETPDHAKAIAKHALQSEKRERIEAMLGLARSLPPIAVLPEDLDLDPYALNLPNGVLDLRTGELAPHDRARLVTKLAPVAYDAQAKAPTWNAFLERIIPDPAVRAYLRRATGYSSTGSVSEQVLFFNYGTGANGKSTFLETVRSALGEGEYAKAAAPDLLLAKRQDRHEAEVVDLRGARFVTTVEVGEGRAWDEARVKWLTGADVLTGRPLYGHRFSFQPTHKFWIAGNHKLRVHGQDLGFWRRLHFIPFTVTIPPEEQDHELLSRLRDELPGILRWIVQGCLEWHEKGLQPPEAVRAATQAYRSSEDVLASFLEERCIADAEKQVKLGPLYEEFRRWADRNGERGMSNRTFGDALEERGFSRHRTGAGRWIQGLALRVDDPAGAEARDAA